MKDNRALGPLKALALRGALWAPTPVTTSQLGEDLSISQQGASEVLRRLERDGYIERWRGPGNSMVLITPKGREVLNSFYLSLKILFERGGRVRIRGRVARGMGEGSYYLSLAPYREEIKKLTGIEAFPGTLNVALDGLEAVKFASVKGFPGLKVKPFTAEGRSFGGARLYPAKLKELKVFVIVPERTHYENVMEIISDRCLRETLDLNDGDPIEVEVEVNCPE